MRHAQASWPNSCDDFSRPLSERGKKDVVMMGEALKVREIYPDLICTSAALRAKTTAELLAQSLHGPAQKMKVAHEIYSASIKDLVGIVQRFDDSMKSCFLVGHNPAITDLADWILGGGFGSLSPGAVVGMSLLVDSWQDIFQGTGKLFLYEYPAKLI